MPVTDKAQILGKSSIFASLDNDELNALAALSVERKLRTDEFVFWEGDAPEWFYIVAGGRVKVLRQTSSGKEFIIAFFEPGEMFGEAAAFQNRPYPASAQAASASKVLRIKKQDFVSFLAAHPEVALGIITMLSGRLRETQSRLKDLASERVEQRIATVLLMLSSKLGPTLPFTRQEIAEMAGTATETAIRVLSQFKERGIITSVRGRIMIADQLKLRLLSEGPPIK